MKKFDKNILVKKHKILKLIIYLRMKNNNEFILF
jgi:hypothetical protein